jgi:hypothetical protein
MNCHRVRVFAALLVLYSGLFGAMTGAAQAAQPTWAPAASASIHPGVQSFTSGAQCTTNFVFYDDFDVYIGQAGHCSSSDFNTQTDGCSAEMLPLGTTVEIGGATKPGTLVYDSWNAMRDVKEPDENACLGNDFALVRLDPADRGRVNPSVPFWGGPNGLDGDAPMGEEVYSYGNSELRFGIKAISPMSGYSLGPESSGWSYEVYTVTPGVFGDSGSAFLGEDGGALGVFSTISLTGSDGVSNLSKALDYMRSHSAFGAVQLAVGTVPF